MNINLFLRILILEKTEKKNNIIYRRSSVGRRQKEAMDVPNKNTRKDISWHLVSYFHFSRILKLVNSFINKQV